MKFVGQKRVWQGSEVVLENRGDTANVVEAVENTAEVSSLPEGDEETREKLGTHVS